MVIMTLKGKVPELQSQMYYRVTLSKLQNVSHPHLPLLQNGSNTTYFVRLLLHLKRHETAYI